MGDGEVVLALEVDVVCVLLEVPSLLKVEVLRLVEIEVLRVLEVDDCCTSSHSMRRQ